MNTIFCRYQRVFFMKKLYLFIFALITVSTSFAAGFDIDSIKQTPTSVTEDRIAILKLQVDSTQNDSVKAFLYAEIAVQYLKYDTISNKKVKLKYQNDALDYSYKALHLFSKYNDTVGLRNCFDNLATVYHSKKVYPQAKWFILQSNSLSRAINDVPNIMKSLIKLAAIKMDIKDYSLAMGDLNEALKLSVDNHDPRTESNVQLNFALLYNRMKNFKKGKIALDRHNFIDDSLGKAELAIAARNAAADSAEIKKKAPIKLVRKTDRVTSSKRIASL
ncbi:tetratricopeptide (TPR) repeat protein [Mucilaginibacter sp. HD30]